MKYLIIWLSCLISSYKTAVYCNSGLVVFQLRPTIATKISLSLLVFLDSPIYNFSMESKGELSKIEHGDNLEWLRKELGGFWTLNWDRVLQEMQEVNPSEEQKAELTSWVVGYMQGALQHGQFGNLEGIDPVLDFLQISRLEFPKEYVEKISKLYKKYSLPFLYAMSPTLYNGKLRGGREYDKIEYTRGLLEKSGASSDELTDEYIEELWDLREILVKLHYERVDPAKLDRTSLLAIVRLLN